MFIAICGLYGGHFDTISVCGVASCLSFFMHWQICDLLNIGSHAQLCQNILSVERSPFELMGIHTNSRYINSEGSLSVEISPFELVAILRVAVAKQVGAQC